MNFQVIKDEYYQNIPDRIKEIVPDFSAVFEPEDGIYPIVGEFGQFILDNIDSDSVLFKCSEFINEALNMGKHETEDVIVLELFEPIYDNSEASEKIRQLLSDKALLVFDKHA